MSLHLTGYALARTLEDIERDAWARHLDFLKEGKYGSAPDADTTAAPRAHKCMHGKLMNEPSRQGTLSRLP